MRYNAGYCEQDENNCAPAGARVRPATAREGGKG